MARLNNRPSDDPRARFDSETPAANSDQENRDPKMSARDKGKAPASRTASRSSLSTTSSRDALAARSNKRKRGNGGTATNNADGEDEDEDFYKYFDPLQDATERREVKRQSRALEREFQEKREEYLREDGNHLLEAVDQANDIFTRVKQTGDATSDSRLLVNVSDLGNKKANLMGHGDSATRVDLDELVSKCITYMRHRGRPDESSTAPRRTQTQSRRHGEDVDNDMDDADGNMLDWQFFGQSACFPHITRPPLPTFLLGPLSVQKRQRAATQRRARNANDTSSREARPEAITAEDLSRSEDSGLTKQCTAIHKLLDKHIRKAYTLIHQMGLTEADEQTERAQRFFKSMRLNSAGDMALFEFVINPHSFGQTVENIFYVSFLIKEGKLEIDFDKDGLPTVSVAETTSIEQQRERSRKEGASRSKSHRHQAVFAIDYDVWEKLIEAYNIREPFITHREEGNTEPTQGGWYT